MSSAPPIPTKNGEVAFVTEKPACSICTYVGTQSQKDSPARAEYDYRTNTGQWAYGCTEHYLATRMYEILGIGKGQKLEVRP